MRNASGKPDVGWLSSAQRSYRHTLEYVGAQSLQTQQLLEQRVRRALDAIAWQPGIGSPINRQGTLRRFPIPKTGHLIEYRIEPDQIIVLRWARQVRRR
jgi:plasmid stabilization system protein ParE